MDESIRELTTKQAVEFLNHTVAKHTLENLRYTGGGPRFRKRGVKREGRKRDTRQVVYPHRRTDPLGDREQAAIQDGVRMSADDNDMWLAVAARLLPNLDILTAHPTRQSLASLIGLSIHEAGLRLVGLREDMDDGHGGTMEPDHGRGHEHDAGRTDRGVYGSDQRPEQSDRQPVPVRDAVAGHGRHRQATAQGERASGIRQQVEAKEQE